MFLPACHHPSSIFLFAQHTKRTSFLLVSCVFLDMDTQIKILKLKQNGKIRVYPSLLS